MKNLRIRRRTAYAGILIAVAAMVGGFILAATTANNPTGSQGTNIAVQKPGGFTAVTWTGGDQIVILLSAADTALGTQASAGPNTLAGTQTAVTSCNPTAGNPTAACTYGFQPAGGSPSGTEVVGDYAEQLQFTLTQTNTAPTAGWDMQVAISGGSLATPVYANAYANAGTCTIATGETSCTSTVTLALNVDLGFPESGPQPTIGQIAISFNNCANAVSCP